MDVLKVLTRSTSLQKRGSTHTRPSEQRSTLPSAGAPVRPQFLAELPKSGRGLKRKRIQARSTSTVESSPELPRPKVSQVDDQASDEQERERERCCQANPSDASVTIENRKHILGKHKIKIRVLEPDDTYEQKATSSRSPSGLTREPVRFSSRPIFPQPLLSFNELFEQYNVSKRLVTNLTVQGYTDPTEIQLAALPLLCGKRDDDPDDGVPKSGEIDLLTVAPTGSGKTLAFLIPLINDVLFRRSESYNQDLSRNAEAIVLAPTLELVDQIVNEGRKLTLGTGVKVSAVRKGMLILQKGSDTSDASLDAQIIKADILVGVPAIISRCIPAFRPDATPRLPDVRTIVLDEADVLLDAMFRADTMAVWNSCCNSNVHVTLWSATLGSSIESLACERILGRSGKGPPRSLQPRKPSKIVRIIAGLKDSTISNIEHSMIYAANEQGKLIALRDMLHPSSSDLKNVTIRPPFLIFVQTIVRAIALHSELAYDISPEAGGASRIAVLHSDLSPSVRSEVMAKFRRGEIWVLITTDLLSRGIDFRGVNGVVNYDIPGSPAAYVHRAGRTGRAGREGGLCVTLYTKEDVPFMKSIANVISAAQKSEEPKSGHGWSSVPKWLLNALPDVSKETRKDLKKKGVKERRNEQSSKVNGKHRMRISTKSGYQRRLEDRRKGSKARPNLNKHVVSEDSEHEFSGFAD